VNIHRFFSRHQLLLLEDSTPQPLCHREIATISNIQEVRWAPEQVWKAGEKRKHFSLVGIRSLNHPACSASLYWLKCVVLFFFLATDWGRSKLSIFDKFREKSVFSVHVYWFLWPTMCVWSVRMRRGGTYCVVCNRRLLLQSADRRRIYPALTDAPGWVK
jgi:hypothetical protein